MNALLEVRGLSKRYGGRLVVSDVTFSAGSGKVIGIIGSNGSGKSTLVKMITALLRPTDGSVSLALDGQRVHQSDLPRLCGMVAPYLQIYDEFDPAEHLRLHAQLHGTAIEEDRIDEVLQMVGLESAKNRIIRSFSSGMRQRVCIALAISLRPPLLVLDEPGVTLDESGRVA
ncbi:MAG: ABC transporter ATP-binding protein, partial [Candidatus Kapabacteria bacterium]|nr:ABC transporter ATP-binding protein [Candidatus Kapabacteria bacterium]